MTTTMQLAICCGPVVTTWDCRLDSQHENAPSFSPNNSDDHDVVDVSWNTSGKVLASCLATTQRNEPNIVLTSQHNRTVLDSFRHDAGLKRSFGSKKMATATCLEFAAKSRYLVVGDDLGAVCLWDLKKKSRVRHYFHSSPSLQATLDPTDSNILSLSANALNIFRLREATLAASIDVTNESPFTKFSASTLEPRHVAIGTQSGSLKVYDVAQQTCILSTIPHSATVTGIEYSHVNKLLVASASRDETLCFSITSNGKVVQQMALESPATSLTFHDDGHTCAVGTESGRVLVYDLRNPTNVVAMYQVDGSVSNVKFAPAAPVETVALKPNRRSTLSSMDTIGQRVSSNDDITRAVDSTLTRSQHAKENKRPSTTTRTSSSMEDKNAIREIVQQELDVVRDEMDEAVRNLQVEMCRHFLKQSQDFQQLVTKLREENEALREENEFLRQTGGR